RRARMRDAARSSGGGGDQRAGWGARIRTWDRGSKVLCLTTWPRPIEGTLGTGTWRKSRWGLGGGLSVRAGRPFAAFDELRDPTATFAAELRVAFAAELDLARFSAAPAELRVALAPELTLARLATLAAEIRVATLTELLLPRLPTAAADLAIEL